MEGPWFPVNDSVIQAIPLTHYSFVAGDLVFIFQLLLMRYVCVYFSTRVVITRVTTSCAVLVTKYY
jgi:hypothetical protein